MRTKSTTFQNKGAKPAMGPLENLRLTWRLLRDPKVAPYAKVVLPILALIYLISPIDLIPDLILGLGQIDDAGVFALLAYFLISLVRRAGLSTVQQTEPTSTNRRPSGGDNVINATYRVVSDPRPRNESKSTP
jgi:uncharacterized membrane protein YkvA (DUF1232 family)